jgi:hypothetical protein
MVLFYQELIWIMTLLAHEKMQRKPSRRSCVKISGCLSRGTRASFRNFSNKEDEGRFIFQALELFVTFWGDAKK